MSAFVAAWLILPAAAPLAAQSPLWAGTWNLDLSRSTYKPQPPPLKRATRRVKQMGNRLTIVDDMVGSRGGIVHLEWTGAFDGADYPVQGVDVALTNAYRLVDELTIDLTQRVDGRVVATARLSLSPDGRTMTTTTSSPTGSSVTIHQKADAP